MDRIAKNRMRVSLLAGVLLMAASAARADGPPPKPMTREEVAAAVRGPAKEAPLAGGAVHLYVPSSLVLSFALWTFSARFGSAPRLTSSETSPFASG